MNISELAWAAGFFDGEGSVGKYYAKSCVKLYPQLSIAQNDRITLDRFNSAVGGVGTVYGPYVRKNPNAQAHYQFRVYGFEKVQAIIGMLWVFLSAPKRAAASKALLQEGVY